jgi:hypothetical protein
MIEKLLRIGLCSLIAVTGIPLTPAHANNWDPWTTVGSAGIVDEADQDLVSLTGPWAGVLTSPATVNLRYNVEAVDGLIQGGGRYWLRVRYIDNGSAAQVVVSLKEVNMTTGAITTRMTFDSNNFASNLFAQTQEITTGCLFPFGPTWNFNFADNAYFLEVSLTRSDNTGSAWLQTAQIRNQYCL